ncbi:hypothetical protein [Nocardiopsis quinghaiensis]|uniref:hypothetical protein n=1 Tax=Nocardiopsis quinghaiensis TaxID=464995 RepID=UPI001680A732|nr:hypothetical protein [Nocardiopsis quinghaiensis]
MGKGTGGRAGGSPSGGASSRAGGRGGAGGSVPGRGAEWGPGGRRKRPEVRPELSGNRRRDDWYHDGDDDDHMVAYAGDRRVRSYEEDNRGLYRPRPGAVIARVAVVLVLLGLVAALLFLVLG